MPLLSELAARFGGECVGGDAHIRGVASLESATAAQLAFFDSSRPAAALNDTKAAAVALTQENTALTARPRWIVANPRLCFARVSALLNPPPPPTGTRANTAVVATTATLGVNTDIGDYAVVGGGAVVGDHCVIHAGVVIGDDCVVGNDCVLHPRAVLYPHARIGDHCIIHAGAVIGGDGFGYVADENKRQQKIPQLGGVRLGNHVEVGANSTIDRGALDDTVIGDGVKIDNLVQIGHNAHIGDGCVICGNVGISGSAVIGSNCVIGGGGGVAGHTQIGDNVQIAGHSAVTRDVAAGNIVMSVWPAMPANQWRRLVAAARRLSQKR